MKAKLFLLPLAAALMLFGCNGASSTDSSLSSDPVESSSSLDSSALSSETPSSESTYSTVSSLSSDDPTDWGMDLSLRGHDFMVSLSTKIKASGRLCTSYSATKAVGEEAAAYPNATSRTFIPFYRAPSNENLARDSECNREHTWPKSRGGNLFETDPIMVRPTFTKDNSDRGNNFYGDASFEWDPGVFGYAHARGEAARIILYCAVTYYDQGVSLSNEPRDETSARTMGTLKTLLKWNREYAPNDFEKLVNNRYDEMGYRRNPFVDHPEYADYIYDDQGYDDSGEATKYQQITDGTNLDQKRVMIVSGDPSYSGYYMMTDEAKSDSLPWYIACAAARYENGEASVDREPVFYSITSKDDGYTLSTQAGKRLYAYVSGTHYSICLAQSDSDVLSHSSDATDICDSWDITLSGGFADIKSKNGKVYLECYRGSFCGYSSAPSVKPMLFA